MGNLYYIWVTQNYIPLKIFLGSQFYAIGEGDKKQQKQDCSWQLSNILLSKKLIKQWIIM